jgi:argininosuccinate lyase
MIAKTDAAGGPGLLPEILEFTSSLALDRALLREDLLGSLAHLLMLARQGLVSPEGGRALREGLVALWEAHGRGELNLPQEEDIHMAVEAALAARLGEVAGRLHTARSRNDQVALDLRLHVREMSALVLGHLARLLDLLAARAEAERETILPAYTHRQRAQPISLAYLFCAYGAMFARDVEALRFVLSQVDVNPLGSGAVAGTSLPIDREITRALLRFSTLSPNALDTVGDRDFVLDFEYAAARSLTHSSRVATDFVDFASSEFGFAQLDGAIACGSSMMPQKRNPDVFELIRAKSGRAVGNLVGLFQALKGLPSGYNRDLQEDRAGLLETGPLWCSVLAALTTALPRVTFDRERCLAALSSDYTQATDLAEALVRRGISFRVAYQAVGTLVRRCQEAGIPLARATAELGRGIHPALDAEALGALDPAASVARKESPGGTGPRSVSRQIAALREAAAAAARCAAAVPRLQALFEELREAPLST